MAALNRPTQATYAVHDQVSVETEDHEDHTFCGILFPIKCRDLLPLDHILITSVAVRGKLGPITVWVTKESASSTHDFKMRKEHWNLIYSKTHPPSRRSLVTLEFDHPIQLYPGQTKAIYIHSTLPGDQAIVYDNQRYSSNNNKDLFIKIMTGRAHVSNEVFGQTPIWGWGNPWRDAREFVGKINYGAIYQLWNPNTSQQFGNHFQTMARTLWMCQRRFESPMSMLPDDVICYILNMCRWDWAKDDGATMKRWKAKARAKSMQLDQLAAAAAATMPPNATTQYCQTAMQTHTDNHNDEMSHDNQDEDDYHDDDYNDDDDDDDDDEDDDDDDDDDDDEYDAPMQLFTYHDDDSDDADDDDDEAETQPSLLHGRPWIARTLARIHVLRAITTLEDGNVIQRRNTGL